MSDENRLKFIDEDDMGYYKILGLKNDAPLQEIEDAYGQLMKSDAWKDKEKRLQIQDAYMNLAFMEPIKSTRNLKLTDEAKQHLYEAVYLEKTGDFSGAARILRKVAELCPEEKDLLLMMAQDYFQAGNSKRAFRSAAEFLKYDPESKAGWMICVMACEDQGEQGKQALEIHRKAHEVGVRGLLFLQYYASLAINEGEYEEASEALWEIVRHRYWLAEMMGNAIDSYVDLAEHMPLNEEGIQAFLDQYVEFIRIHKEILTLVSEGLTPIYGFMERVINQQLVTRTVYNQIILATDEIRRIHPKWKKDIDHLQLVMLNHVLLEDPRALCVDWAMIVSAFANDFHEPEKMMRFNILERELRYILERDLIWQEAELIKSEYPRFYELLPDLVDKLISGDTEQLFARLKREYDKLSPEFEETEFDRMYRRMGGQMHARDAMRILQENKGLPKVRRNDPCPCGSGKKYKNCCLGKAGGIA